MGNIKLFSEVTSLPHFAHYAPTERRTLQHEELTDRPAHVLNEITGFLQLPPLGAETTSDTFHVHGVASPIRNMNAESIARLLPDEVDAIRAEAGPTLEQFGYEPA